MDPKDIIEKAIRQATENYLKEEREAFHRYVCTMQVIQLQGIPKEKPHDV